MKKLIFYFAIATFVGTGLLNAMPIQETTNPEKSVTIMQAKEKIDKEDLPVAVQKTLKGDQYKDWTIETVWEITRADNAKFYSIEFTSQGETKVVDFTSEGKVIA